VLGFGACCAKANPEEPRRVEKVRRVSAFMFRR
jgi:hypothetical protein